MRGSSVGWIVAAFMAGMLAMRHPEELGILLGAFARVVEEKPKPKASPPSEGT